ncbi:MAG: hypothetical protein IKN11_03490 [Bacteroidales bacterium]|nr:hypothetical protein [Bacteroidales bacterium]
MSNYYGYIIPECFIDTMLTQFLLGNRVNHQHSCNNVVKVMRAKYRDDFAVGIIDDDKDGVSYLREFQLIGQTKHLKFYSHLHGKHHIITVNPAMDRFIMDCTNEIGHSLNDFGLPTTLKEFTKLTKNENILTDRRVKQLLATILGHDEIEILKNVLCYLLQSRYDTSTDDIIALIK